MDTDTIQKQLDTFVKKTVSNMHVERIILYGSALHDRHAAHDIDLIVIGNFPTKDPESFLYDLYTDIPRSIDFHTYGISIDQKKISPFLKAALREGKVVYSA